MKVTKFGTISQGNDRRILFTGFEWDYEGEFDNYDLHEAAMRSWPAKAEAIIKLIRDEVHKTDHHRLLLELEARIDAIQEDIRILKQDNRI